VAAGDDEVTPSRKNAFTPQTMNETTSSFNLQLERWSVGVLENRTHDIHLPEIKPEIDGILFLWSPRELEHYSITPTLHNSLDFSRRSLMSVTPDVGIFDRSRGTGFLR
jgi:hypothetical protein